VPGSRDIDGQTREGERAGENESIARGQFRGPRQWRSRERPTWTGSPQGERVGTSESLSGTTNRGAAVLLQYRENVLKEGELFVARACPEIVAMND
jgi:hypothetical protein